MKSSMRAININACAQKVEVDNRISLHYYYRIADTLLKQASIYREEHNLIDLYIILLRFSSLMCETIPSHRDYQVLLPKERATFRKKLLGVVNELESLKPDVQHQVDEVNRGHMFLFDDQERISYDPTTSSVDWLPTKKQVSANSHIEQPTSRSASDQLQIGRKFQKLSLSVPLPKEETLSRHSILGPNGLWGQQTRPITSLRVEYPSNADLIQTEISCLNQAGKNDPTVEKDCDFRRKNSEMESVLLLDDGRWSLPAEELCSAIDTTQEDLFKLNVRQPSPPPVLAQVQQAVTPIPPSKVADPRPGLAKTSQNGMPNSKTYQHLQIPVNMLECFLRLAEMNTLKNVETCGVLAGSLKNSMFYVTTLIIPKQEATSDSCQTTNEEEIFDFQDKRNLFPLGWIHTHPTQTCFMSSIDLHTHYSYQIMLPEAIAIVMAPTDTSRTHGIFHLSDPGGVSVIRNCEQRGFHPHEEPSDGSSIYEHCSHVYMNPNMKFEVEDLR